MTRLSSIRRFRPARSGADRGATSTEYALIAFLIAIVTLAAVAFLGRSTQGLFDRTATSVSNAIG